MIEIEYKLKSTLLDYLIDIGSEMIAFVLELTSKDINNDEYVYTHLLRLAKTKLQKYKQNHSVLKEKKLFDIHEFNNKSNVISK